MKHIILTILLTVSLSAKANAPDTISVWHVFYNNIKIKEFTETDKKPVLILKRDDLKKGDSISVKYSSDMRCEDCLTGLMLSVDDKFIMLAKSVGRGNPLSFPVDYLLDRKRKKLKLIYIDSNGDQANSIPLFDFKIE